MGIKNTEPILCVSIKMALVHEDFEEEEDEDMIEFDEPLVDDVPLWKQFFYLQQQKERNAPSDGIVMGAKQEAQQKFLSHLKQSRKAIGLPPFFAMISSPSFSIPYRMEGLKVTLGRNTRAQKHSDIHLPGSKKIAHTHVTIQFCEDTHCYYLINHSRNGILIKTNENFTQYTVVGQRIALPNPAVFNVQGVLIYFQLFYVAPRNHPVWSEYSITKEEADTLRTRAPRKPARLSQSSDVSGRQGESEKGLGSEARDDESDEDSQAPPKKRRKEEAKDEEKTVVERSKPYKGEVSYSDMIKTALVGLGGSGTQKEIGDFIEEHFKQYLVKSTWRKAVSGILSSNSKFQSQPCKLQNGKKARFCTWHLIDESDEIKKRFGSVPSVIAATAKANKEDTTTTSSTSPAASPSRATPQPARPSTQTPVQNPVPDRNPSPSPASVETPAFTESQPPLPSVPTLKIKVPLPPLPPLPVDPSLMDDVRKDLGEGESTSIFDEGEQT